ncbi:MAG: hypothetical protein HY952_07775 [Elusimicrobia bacterium]|nr:hypothetical protein [Elusimicrobiota bacterium]
MSPNKADSLIPAAARTAADLTPAWGRFTAITPQDAEFLSHFELAAGKTLLLDFELGATAFADVRARVCRALRDPDGYYNYELQFLDPAQRGLLKNALEKLPRD